MSPVDGKAAMSGLACVSADLLDLAHEMEQVASKMEYYGGFDAEIVRHAKELEGAAEIARGWAKGIRASITPRQHETKEDACG